MKRLHLIIKGNVTGLGFRKFIKDNATKLNLKGWVKNKKDSVEAVFEGKVSDVHKMLILCKVGPKAAKVDILNSKEEPVKSETTFKIIK